ncbi:hypothetical protein ABAZ39_14825 (plasmid) [Azospirillum argentinense]|uniref:Uncharacterized protein n=1 Tax=Azospirillum argentinense TaxID=2970906 RepID=A0A060DPX1_9PROT|nr:hypothetical protein [Azospirillum argentinense]AIB13233.1 hypothetical protein ABAZ39_14825 [Azospirillum argentinense]EZQ05019.1 hypothetical protein ABAZ39_14760 [Azospirillum argentinense]PNQ95157.1 hypothetical protein C1S70_30440 [Azospirillum argentinense]
MPSAEHSTRRFGIWAGLATGPVAAFLQQQGGSALVPWTCAQSSGWPAVALGLALATATAVAGWVSWRARRPRDGRAVSPDLGNRRFVAGLSTGIAAFFILVILAQALAAVFLTGCER